MQDMNKIMGLTTGADDYVTKPFQPLELAARMFLATVQKDI
jgi:two-component system response regulator VanR